MRNKKYLDVFLIGLFLVGIFVFIKRNVNKLDSKEVAKYPITEIQFSFDTSIVLGKVNSIMPVTYNGYIRNIGNANLHIDNLKTSCGCTDFVVSKLIIEPMDSTKVSFNIHPIEKGIDVINIYFDANTKQKKHKLKIAYEAVKP
jgi:hypothetical protein